MRITTSAKQKQGLWLAAVVWAAALVFPGVLTAQNNDDDAAKDPAAEQPSQEKLPEKPNAEAMEPSGQEMLRCEPPNHLLIQCNGRNSRIFYISTDIHNWYRQGLCQFDVRLIAD